MTHKYTEKEKLFIFAHIGGANLTQASILAGYAPKGASQVGYRLSRMQKIIDGLALAKSEPDHPSLKRYSNSPKIQSVVIEQQSAAQLEIASEKTKHDTQAAAFVDALKTTSTELKIEKSSPELFLESVMMDEECEPRLRMDAAKALLPYRSQKLGEVGKKEEKQQAAKKAGAGKFAATVTPPQLRAFN